MNKIHRISSLIKRPIFNSTTILNLRSLSTKSGDEWNDAWESAWLPEELSAKNRAPWEADVNFSLSQDIPVAMAPDIDPEAKAFVEDMNDNWEQRRKKSGKKKMEEEEQRLLKLQEESRELYSLENVKKDYRLKKQRVHAGLWMKEIEKLEESKLALDADFADSNDIERLLDTASDIFDSGNSSLNDSKLVSVSELKNKPDGWETTSKAQDGNIWEMSQREEDILLQEFERRIAFSKFQIASFIKTHIFSRRRPIDGWKYMIEELGPNAKKGKGSVSRLPSVADPSTQPYKEEKIPIPSSLPMKGR